MNKKYIKDFIFLIFIIIGYYLIISHKPYYFPTIHDEGSEVFRNSIKIIHEIIFWIIPPFLTFYILDIISLEKLVQKEYRGFVYLVLFLIIYSIFVALSFYFVEYSLYK